MSTFFGTLQSLLLYIGLVAVGAILGSRPFLRSRKLAWLGRLPFAALLILNTALGVKLGANDEVISSHRTIGVSALLVTVLALIGSVVCVLLTRKYILRLDKKGLPLHSEQQETEEEKTGGGKADNASTIWIVAAVLLGMLAGRFLLPPAVTAYCGTVIDIGLYLLLFLVGMDMGKQGGVGDAIRQAGLGVLLIQIGRAHV